MSERPRTKRFQVHFSTAIVLMFVAGGLIWANVRERIARERVPVWVRWDVPDTTGYFGWPIRCVAEHRIIKYFKNGFAEYQDERPFAVDYSLVALNAAVAFVLLIFVWFACERWLRRNEAQAGA